MANGPMLTEKNCNANSHGTLFSNATNRCPKYTEVNGVFSKVSDSSYFYCTVLSNYRAGHLFWQMQVQGAPLLTVDASNFDSISIALSPIATTVGKITKQVMPYTGQIS